MFKYLYEIIRKCEPKCSKKIKLKNSLHIVVIFTNFVKILISDAHKKTIVDLSSTFL